MKASFRSRPWAGLDVGSFSVKLVATQGARGARAVATEMPLLSPESDPENDGPPSPEAVARVIAQCLSAAGVSPRSFKGVSVGIGGPDVIVKQITLPFLDDSEVGPALRFEARKHLPFDPQTMVLDYQILGRYTVERKLEILLAAVSTEHMERHLQPLRLLGIEADILDAAPLALANAMLHGSNPGSAVLLDIGHASSHLAIYQRGQPFFSRRFDFGGRDLTQAIAGATEVPFAEAEEWKLATGSDQPGLRADWNGPELSAVHDCLRDRLAEELRRSFAFYGTLGSLPDPMRLYLSGGSARFPGLATRLGELLGYPVLLFNPIDMLEPARGGPRPAGGPQFAQAFGLAMRSA